MWLVLLQLNSKTIKLATASMLKVHVHILAEASTRKNTQRSVDRNACALTLPDWHGESVQSAITVAIQLFLISATVRRTTVPGAHNEKERQTPIVGRSEPYIGSTPIWRCLDYFEPSRAKPEGSK